MENEENVKKIFNFLLSVGCTPQGAAGMTGNIYAESRCNPMCVEGALLKWYKKDHFLKWDYGIYDENSYRQYWEYVRAGAITEQEFMTPRSYTGAVHQFGAGLCQWTTKERKKRWLSLAKDDGKPLTDLGLQLNLLYYELKNIFPDAARVLHRSINTKLCSNYILHNFERPANAKELEEKRYRYSEAVYELCVKGGNMSVTIGSARIDENGHAHGGKAGDQTGREVSEQRYYKHSGGGWRAFRLKNPNQARRAAYAMRGACDDGNWGYDQYQRTTGMKAVAKYGYDPSKLDVAAETDCSNLVRTCFIYATGKDPGDFDTSGEANALLKTGLVTEINFNQDTGEGLCDGDILVTKKKGHTVIVTDGAKRTDDAKPAAGGNYVFIVENFKRGDKNNSVFLFQECFNARNVWYKWGQKPLALDKDCGPATEAAVRWYQKQRGLKVDGECGPETWKDILALKTA